MDVEAELATLQAEALAVQAVLIAVCRRLARQQPELGPALCAAFDEAETHMSGIAFKLGLNVPHETMLNSLRIIEELRSAVITDEGMCEPGDRS